MDTIIIAICSNDGLQPIFRQILLNFVAIVNNADWVRWSDNIGLMPLLIGTATVASSKFSTALPILLLILEMVIS